MHHGVSSSLSSVITTGRLGRTFVKRETTWPARVCSNLVSCIWAGNVDMVEISEFGKDSMNSLDGARGHAYAAIQDLLWTLLFELPPLLQPPEVLEDHRADVSTGLEGNGRSRGNRTMLTTDYTQNGLALICTSMLPSLH